MTRAHKDDNRLCSLLDDMAMAITSLIPTHCGGSASALRRRDATRIPSVTPSKLRTNQSARMVPLQASPPNNEVPSSENTTKTDSILPQEDLSYLIRLGVGSMVGAAVIKYGSILFPEITRPNLFLAIVIISTPVLVAVLLLINQSRESE